MSTFSIVFLIALLVGVIYALYIHAMRSGRDSKGRFAKQEESNEVMDPLFYSDLRKDVI